MEYSLSNSLVGGSGSLNPDKLSLDLQFATDKTLTARRGPTPVFTRANPTATFVGSNGFIQTATTDIPRFDHDTSYVGSSVYVNSTGAATDPANLPLPSETIYFSGMDANGYPTFYSDTYEIAFLSGQWRLNYVGGAGSGEEFSAYSDVALSDEYVIDVGSGVIIVTLTLACKGLLIEGQRTNLVTYSNEFSNATWIKTGSSIQSSTLASPDNTSTNKLVENSANSQHLINSASFSVTSGTSYTCSCYVKAAERSQILFALAGTTTIIADAYVNISSNANSVYAGNGWYRVSVTGVAAASGTVFFYIGLAVNGVKSYQGDGTSGVYIYGAQVEAEPFATSYIPRVIGTGIRSADVCSITSTAFSGFYNQTEGTFVTQTIKPTSSANAFCFHASDNTFNNGLDLRYNSITNAGAVMNVSNVSQLTGFSGTITSGSNAKQSLAYKLNDCAYSLNGGTAATDSTASIPTVNRLNIGAAYTTGYELNGTISSIRYFKKRLPNAKLQAITT